MSKLIRADFPISTSEYLVKKNPGANNAREIFRKPKQEQISIPPFIIISIEKSNFRMYNSQTTINSIIKCVLQT